MRANRAPYSRRARGWRLLLATLGAILGISVVGMTSAFAYFSFTDSSNAHPAQAVGGAIGAPISFNASAASPTSALLSWTAPSSPAPTSYTLSQSTGTLTGCSSTPTAATTSCTATGLTGGTNYTWTLTALDHSWTSTATMASTTTLAADGSGTLTTPTTSVAAGSTGNTITFTYTAATGGINNGTVTLAVPSGWSAPSTTGSAAGFTTASTGTVSVATQIITVSGVTLSGGQTFNIVYGSKASSGPGATATATAGSQIWQGKDKSTSGGILTNVTSPSITVIGTATKLVLTAQTTTPTAGAGDNLTITAEDSAGDTATSYTGSKTLTFSGASVAPNGTTHPTVTTSSGTAVNFGSTTAITFTGGVAQVSGSNNGVMTLFDAQTTSITVSDGLISNGTGLPVTVRGAAPASLTLANCVVQGTSQACNGTYKLGGTGGTMVANVQALDTWANGATITTAINMSVTSGSTSTYSISSGSTLTIDGTATPPYQSTATFTVQKLSSATNQTTITVHVTSGPSLSDLTFTVTK